MIRAELKRLYSTHIVDLENFRPNGPFGFSVQAIVGPAGGKGEESFDFTLCTPEWLASHMSASIAPGRHFLFVNNFNYSALENYVRDFCYSCEGASWHAVAEKVGRLGKWEFEDYVP